jgi:TetR/AcrR family transcriptional regulator
VLEAAEPVFGERGFDAARLEDIAKRVGIRRASIVYYFKDKRELYEAVLDRVFGDLHDEIARALDACEGLPQRIETSVSTWVHFVGRRPTTARLILREVADAGPGQGSRLVEQSHRFAHLVVTRILAGRDAASERLEPIDPLHLGSMVIGATVFFVAAMPALVPKLRFDPLSPEQLEAHEQEVLRVVRRLLGLPDPAVP